MQENHTDSIAPRVLSLVLDSNIFLGKFEVPYHSLGRSKRLVDSTGV